MIGAPCFVAFQYLHRRLIHMNERIAQHLLVHQVDQRHDILAAEQDHPARHRGAWQRHADARELRLLAVKRCAIDVLGRGDMCKQRGCRIALGKQLRRCRSKPHALLATGAAVLQAHMSDDLQLRRHVVQLLGLFIADHLKGAAIVRAALVALGQIMNDFDARQFLRQRFASRLPAYRRRDHEHLGRTVRRRRMRDGLSLIEQQSRLVGRDLIASALLRGATEQLGFEPAILFV